VIGAVTRTQHFGWIASVAVPRALVFAPLRHSIFRLLAVGGVALGVSLLLAVFVARKLSRPITALAETAVRFDQSGAVPPVPPPALREADEVARVLESSMRRRRAAEDAANDAETRATRVIEDAPCGVILFGPDGAWRFVNQATCDLLGRPAEELIGLSVASPELDVRDASGNPIPVDERASARALRGETVRGLEVSMARGDGSRVYMLFNSAPLRDRDGRITGALTAMLDISERRAAQERLARLLQTLESRVEEEIAAREAAQAAASQAQKMQALGQLAGGVAHDFNNVLQTIAGAVSLIDKRAENPEAVRRFAKTISSAADRGASVAGRLLAFARRSDLTPAPMEAAALLADIREILIHTLGGDVAVIIEASPDAGWLLADRAQLETALVNLAANARDAMPDGGTLTLRARPQLVRPGERHQAGLAPGAYVRLDVEDTGIGMDAATLARATEPFFTTKPLNKGTGLGLAMVRGFAEQLEGGIAISSRAGSGTTVALWLPATDPCQEAGPEKAVSAPVRRASGIRVLLVDDEPAIRAVLAEELGDRGWLVEQASCAQEGIELLREANFDVLVADQSMPGESGVALIGLARRLRPGLPAILLTGLAPEIGAELTESPAEAAITELVGKPIRPRELAGRIEALLTRARGQVR
jgi:PAS domain S-box-containing protein